MTYVKKLVMVLAKIWIIINDSMIEIRDLHAISKFNRRFLKHQQQINYLTGQKFSLLASHSIPVILMCVFTQETKKTNTKLKLKMMKGSTNSNRSI